VVAGEAGEGEAVGGGVDLGVDVAVATEVAGGGGDHAGELGGVVFFHADEAEEEAGESSAEPLREAVDGAQLERLGGEGEGVGAGDGQAVGHAWARR
jgi:hypothetical protein